MFQKICFGLCLALVFSPTAYAKDLLSAEFTRCVDQTGGVTSTVLNCIAAEHDKQDQKLNQSYNELMRSLKGNRKQGLVDAQRLWLKFRDANCKFYAEPNGGTHEAIFRANCLLNMTAERAHELRGLKRPD